jgi:hypothetical protein
MPEEESDSGRRSMSAKPQLVTVTMEEARALNTPRTDERSGSWFEAIKMTAQKALTPSVSVSPAVIGLIITLVIQTVVIVWWAASISKDNQNNAEEIKTLKSDLSTQKVYIDTTREKFIKMEALVDALQRESQLKKLLSEEKGR